MGFGPNIVERIARARADLRMGVPVVLDGGALMFAVETLDQDRLNQLDDLTGVTLVITSHRAKTLHVVPYDSDLARIALPHDVDLNWIRAVADPADDLNAPMKGPLRSERGGDATLHRAAIALTKAARLLPAAIVVHSSQVPQGSGVGPSLLRQLSDRARIRALEVLPVPLGPLNR